MHYSIDRLTSLPVHFEDTLQEGSLKDAALMESESSFDLDLTQCLGNDSFYSFHNVREAVRQVVDDDHVGISLLEQMDDCMRANEAESPGY